MRDTVALMRGFRIYDHTEKVGEAAERKGLRCWFCPRSGGTPLSPQNGRV